MRLVLDTNTIKSALFWNGAPHRLIAAARDNRGISFYTTTRLLAELADVIGRGKFSEAVRAANTSPDGASQKYMNLARIITPASVPPVIIADPDDDHVLACALADLIVSGDSDLLNLKRYQSIEIVTAAAAFARVSAAAGG